MSKKLTVIQVVDLSNNAWVLGQPLKGREASIIKGMVRVGNTVEVFAQNPTTAHLGDHAVLMAPTISTVIAIASQADWQELLGKVPDNIPKVNYCLDIAKNEWKVGQPTPGETDNTIAAMFLLGEMVEIFVSPNPGSEYANNGIMSHITLMPLTVQRTLMTDIQLQSWARLMQEAVVTAESEMEDLDDEDNDTDADDGDEEEEIEEPVRATRQVAPPSVPFAGGPPAMLSGAALQTAMTTATVNGTASKSAVPTVQEVPPQQPQE
jgi:hypothetical protein